MKIEHIAIWVKNLEEMRSFYEKYFHASSNEKYINPTKGFSSYFLTFSEGARLELMHRVDIIESSNVLDSLGIIHFAVSVGSKMKVEELTARLELDGYEVPGQPRMTGDGYYESVVKDPEGNQIEITI